MSIFYDKLFADIDVTLRRGGHINRSSFAMYEYMCSHFDDVSIFYNRYGCSVHQHPDGFFYMNAKGSLIRTRMLPRSCVHLGLFIALKARDPEITRSSGRIGIAQLLQDIETSVPRETLQRTYAPKRRDATVDASVADEIYKALKILHELNFIELARDQIRPLEAIHRFAEVARHNNAPDSDARIQLSLQRGIEFEGDTESATSEDADYESQD